MQKHAWASIAIAASLVLHAGVACAEDDDEEQGDEEPAPLIGRMAVPRAERPLTLPQLVLEPTSQVYVDRQVATFVDLRLGASFGITDNLQIDTVIAPLKLSPPVTYGELDQRGPSLGATYRLINRRTQLGLRLDATVLTSPGASGVELRPGIPVQSRSGDHVRIDYGLFVRATRGRTSTYGFDLPFILSVDLAPPVHIGFQTAIRVQDTDVLGITIPVGLFCGFAIRDSDGPILDIDPFVLWPQALGGDGPQRRTPFQTGIALRGYFYL